MNGNQEAFQALLDQVRAGCNQAVSEIIHSYGPCVRSAIREHLSRQVRSQFDTNDLEQRVWLLFLDKLRNGLQVESPYLLEAWLAIAAQYKVREANRYCHESCRDIDREVHLHQATEAPELAALQSAPGDELAEQDWWERGLEKLPSNLREIAIARKEGQSLDEIAAARSVSVKTIRRALEKIRESLSEIHSPPAQNK